MGVSPKSINFTNMIFTYLPLYRQVLCGPHAKHCLLLGHEQAFPVCNMPNKNYHISQMTEKLIYNWWVSKVQLELVEELLHIFCVDLTENSNFSHVAYSHSILSLGLRLGGRCWLRLDGRVSVPLFLDGTGVSVWQNQY